jgi:hypothetical protein
MATARAIANGNWSSTSTWNGGVLPGNGDTVYANGFNVTINQDINIGGANNPTVNAGSFVSGQWYEVLFVGTTSWTGIGAASNTAGTIFLATGVGTGTGNARALATLTTAANTPAGAAAGGGFTMSTVYAMTCDCRAGTTSCLNLTATSGTLALTNLRIFGGTASGAHGISASAGSLWSASGCILTSGSTTNANAFNNASTGLNSLHSSAVFGNAGALGINNAAAGTLSITGLCAFTGGASGGSSHALNNAAAGAIVISGSNTFVGGNGTSYAVNNAAAGTISSSDSNTFSGGPVALSSALNNASTGTVILTNSTFAASAFANAVSSTSTSADVRLSGDFLDHWSGWKAVNSPRFRLGTAPTLGQTRYALAGTTDSYFTMYGADNGSFGNPIAANVRSGIVYGGGNLTGTCAVPAAGSVSLGVPVDATTGTAALTPAAVWSHATRTITGGLVDTATTLTNAPTVPSVVQIRQEMDSNSTKLANLDATISSRSILTTGDLPSVPSAASVASAVRTELTEISNLDASVSSRLASSAYTAPTSAPSASAVATAVRTELGTELGRIDQSISSRLASADYTTPPTTAQIATAVEGSLLNENDGQAVLNALVGAIGNQNVDEIALVAAIRSDLERSGGKLDSIPTDAAPSAASVASAVWSASTKEITGGTVTTLTNSPDVPTEAEIASQVRTELSVELGRIDAAISSRLAPSGTLATVTTLTNAPTVPTAAAIADEVRVELATELARLDAPVSGATAPSAATVATAVRSELSVELARVDQAVSTRLAGSAYTAPANSDVAAIKTKTDAINVDRINNTATTAIVGNLLAQANS